MVYILMNEDKVVANLDIAQEAFCSNETLSTGFINKLNIIDFSLLPFSVKYAHSSLQKNEFERWMYHRLIPDHRDGAVVLKEKLKCNFLEASLKSHGTCLTDGYWFKEENEDITWKSVNFYNKKFSYVFGNICLNYKDRKRKGLYDSPDLTTNGQMKKTWRYRDDKIWLLKQGQAPDFEEPFNEKAASDILSVFSKLPYVKYDLACVNEHMCSICENFIQEGIEFIPAAELFHTAIKPEYLPLSIYMEERCKFFKIPGYKDFFDNMRLLDYLISNSDRHLGNYGFLYEPSTLSFKSPAPIFDNGTSLWNTNMYDIPVESLESAKENYNNKIYKLHHPLNIDLSKLDNVKDIIENAYTGSMVPPAKVKNIALSVKQRQQVAEEQLEKAKTIYLTKNNRAHEKDIERA